MGGIISSYTESKETEFVYESTSGLITERVLRMMYPDEIDANQFPNIQDDGTFLLPPEFSDASLYGAPYLVMQKRRNAIKEFIQRKMQDPRTFWKHFCKTLDIEMNPKPTVVIRVDQDGIIHTDCQNGEANIQIEFDESDEESDKGDKEEKEEEDNIEMYKKPKKEKREKQDKKEKKRLEDLELENLDESEGQKAPENELVDDLDDDFESSSGQKKKSSKNKRI